MGDQRFRLTHASEFDPRIDMDPIELYFYDERESWAKDMSMEIRFRRSDRGSLTNRTSPAVFVGWHNLEVWSLDVNLW